MSTKLVNEMEKGNIKWWDNAQGQNSERKGMMLPGAQPVNFHWCMT